MMHILCLGDSITDCGRIWENPPFGYGYVQMLEKNLHKFHEDISVINAGVDGFTVSRLLENTKAGRYPVKDSIVTVLIGINDIGLMMNTNRTEGQKEDMLRKFLDNYEKMIGILIREAKEVILLEPFIFFCPEEFRLWIPYVKRMSEGIKKFAENYGIQYVMLQSRLDEAVAVQGVSFITTDGIHLTENGHAILAETLLEAINRTDIVEEQKMEEKILTERFEFRSIHEEEADQAVAIEQICFPPNEACSEMHMKKRIKKVPELFLVAVDKKTGKLAGFLNGLATSERVFRDEFFTDENLHEPAGENVMLLGLDVLPEYRKQGLAREIVNQYAGREQENGRKTLILTCQQAKVEMYKKMGFHDNGIANSVWGGEEWHEMSRIIES